MNYKNKQRARALALMQNGSEVFYGDGGGGIYNDTTYPFVLQNGIHNLYAPIQQDAADYFLQNKITWWGGSGPSNHTQSSQIACLNHLFPIRRDKAAALTVARKILPGIAEVLSITTDKAESSPAYIQFEAVSDTDHLCERMSTRGINCTSVDALLYGRHMDGRRIILLIEWKYTEAYSNKDMADGGEGITRRNRYDRLIAKSKQLKPDCEHIYYYEPFYQLMRQTLWAEQMIIHNQTETVTADDFVHLHVIPPGNRTLLDKIYPCSGKRMEDTWRTCIQDQSKYAILSPWELLADIDPVQYKVLLQYLRTRYWE